MISENELTREQIVYLLRSEGYELSERTLRYWEQSGKLPKPVRRGRRVYHNEDVLPMVRLLAATRPQRIQKIRQSVVPSMGRIVRMSQDGDVLTVVIRKGKNIEQTQTN